MPIHVGEVICSAMLDVLKRSRDSLAFPSLIILLCQDAGVDFGDYQQRIRAVPPISTALVKDMLKPQKSSDPGLTLPAKFRPKLALPVKEQLHQIAKRQTALHARQNTMLLLLETMTLNIDKKMGMTSEQIYYSLTVPAPHLRAAAQHDLPPFNPNAPRDAPNSTESKAVVNTLPGFSGELPFLLETGYISVNDSELFYYFIESHGNPQEDPLFLWLTGGPGCSSLSGLLYETGPIEFDINSYIGGLPKLAYYPYAWTKTASIIFLDSPVGTGFSYSKTTQGWETSDSASAWQSYHFLRKWLEENPPYLLNQLFIAGDSYSGLVVPLITKLVVEGNEAGLQPRLNLKGYLVGSPHTDEFINSNSIIPFAHRMALISDKLYEEEGRLKKVKEHSVHLTFHEGARSSKAKPGPFAKLLESRGICAQYTMSSTPQRNGVAKRQNCTIIEMVKSMLSYSSVPMSLWMYVLKTAAYLLNRVPSKAIPKTPYELLTGKKPSLKHLHVWGCPVEKLKSRCNGNYVFVDPSNVECLAAIAEYEKCIKGIWSSDILEPNCELASTQHYLQVHKKSLQENPRDFVLSPPRIPQLWCRAFNYALSYSWANDGSVQEALHVRKGKVKEWDRCNKSLSYTYDVQSVVHIHKWLSKRNLTVLVECGDRDMVVPFVGTEIWLRALNLTVVVKWRPWYVDDQVAGYTREYSENGFRLTYVTLKGAGHTAPEFNRRECYEMFQRWLHAYPL
ncbi:serine carboxypeptidase-like 18 [Abrus precatorius]|uniref:Serine carboxypeptidase-like 18 n=1 Tax=Abrus precatorius TaxID=3816 RepID=A0A8B8M5S7_ABRPR|nr:serine carboxypeptidase-like 18 [Abrus precatorius]